MKNEWQENFFDADYLSLYESHLTEERTAIETSFLEKFVFEPDTHLVLDIPCGYGRHSLCLVKKGYEVHGIDNSETMIRRAQLNRSALPIEQQNKLTYEVADMRSYAVPEKKFDVVLNLFSSFGYFHDAISNEAVLSVLSASVRKGGRVVIDVKNPLRDILELSNTGWRMQESIGNVKIVQILDPIRMRYDLIYQYKDGAKVKEMSATLRHYFLSDFEDMLTVADCTIEKVFGNFKGDEYTENSGRLIVVARKN